MYYQHERERRFTEGIDQKEGLAADYEIQHEIKRLREGTNTAYDPKIDLIKEKEDLEKRVHDTYEEDTKAFLIAQIKEVDASLENAMRTQSRDQDTALSYKVDARKRKRQRAIGMDRAIRSRHTQERIAFQLDRTDDFAIKSKQLTRKAVEDIIKDMQLEKASEEIPGAVDRLLDEKNQKELEDLLLRLFEQKSIEMKEEILALMEEKLQRIQLAKKNHGDRKAGIEAIINGGKAS